MTSIVDCISISNWPNYENKFTSLIKRRDKSQLTKFFWEEFSNLEMEINPTNDYLLMLF